MPADARAHSAVIVFAVDSEEYIYTMTKLRTYERPEKILRKLR